MPPESSIEVLGEHLRVVINVTPLAVCCVFLIGGQMLAAPFISSTVASLSAGRQVGTYFGIHAVAQGVGAALGNFAGGAAFDLSREAGIPGLPWALMAAVGLACAAGVIGLDRFALRTVKSPAERSTPDSRTALAGAR